MGINGQVLFRCSLCTDQDRKVCGGVTSYPVDTVTYTWSATCGSFPYGNTGREVTWIAPPTPGPCVVTVTVDDVDARAPAGCGADNDPAKQASLQMNVIRLEQARVYFSYPGTAYPYILTSQFKTRAVVRATSPSGTKDYCAMLFDQSLQWWMTGNEGPRDDPDDQAPPMSSEFTGEVMSYWPSNWPPLTIKWEMRDQTATAQSCAGGNRKYSYATWTYLVNGWGEDNRTYNTPGIHRLRATATMHPGTTWVQTKPSLDKEVALRICPKRDITTAGTLMREKYVEWISTYELEPYEWGGEGFGGYDSPDTCVGGGDGYEGYGIDCSGLVSCGAHRAGYNWGTAWRQTTTGLASDTYSEAVSYDEFDEGDILNKAGHHVVSCSWRSAGPDTNVIKIIHASGDANKVLQEDSTITEWTGDGYSRRRLKAH